MLMRIGLREMIINAIEHGNLEISYDEKTKALQNNTYFELLSERRKDPKYYGRKVTIDSIISSTKAIFRITDDGNGFDVGEYVRNNNCAIETPDAHGRGILMARQIFHQVP
jgi:anti-sigma regulatory factor (Ser/Thr protein kinase)